MSTPGGSDFDRGRKVGKYEILTRLSVGGMAELHLAFISGAGGFKKFVALKQVLPDVRADDSFVKMFLDEARITAALNHPNIAQVFELGEDPTTKEPFIAMEFVSGQNLEQLIKRAAKREVPIPVGFACRVIRDSLLGLHYAHHFTEPSTGQPMPVVHRDVSPKNVMITYAGQVKVIDFGIAKAKGRLNRTQVGIVKGTSGYMSPEQVKNEPLDGRCDLFATAVMLHELLAGERLFTAPSDAAMMIKIVEGELPLPTVNNPYVSEQLCGVVMKGLERELGKRWASGKEFARALDQAVPDAFDDEQVAAFMTQLFEDKIALTRALFEMANEEQADERQMTQAVQGITSEEGEGTPRPRKATSASRQPTPRPRSASQQALPRAGSQQALPRAGSQQALPRVGDKPRNGQSGLNPKLAGPRSQQGLPRVSTSKRSIAPVPEAPAQDTPSHGQPRAEAPPAKARGSAVKMTPVAPGEETIPPAKKSGAGATLLLAALFVALLAGAGWAVTLGPLKDTLHKVLAGDQEPPPDTDARPLALPTTDGKSSKPKWMQEREAQRAQEQADAEARKAAEDAANDPDRVRMLAEIQAQIAQLDHLEAEQHTLKIEARAGKSTGEANSKKIDDLQKQIDDLKGALQSKQAKAAPKPGTARPDSVQVVTDTRSAKKAEVGYLTLRTVNPGSAAVHEGEFSLGSTPLVKFPLDVGAHTLRVVDGDGKVRSLSVNIEAARTLEIKGVDVASLPMMQ